MQKKLNQFRNFSWIFVTVAALLLLSACTNKDEYTLEFETNGGQKVNEITFNINDPLTELPEPTKEGYVFSGWYLDEALTEAFDLENINDHKTTLYAKWIDENGSISITYNISEDISNQSIDVKVNDIPEPYAPRKDGYVFKGWYLDEAYENIYDYEHGFNKDTTLYAKWEERSDVVLTIAINQDLSYEFNVIDGDMPDIDRVIPTYLVQDIYMYFIDSRMSTPFDDNIDITESLMIYAKLKNHSYIYYEEVSFDQMDQIIDEDYALKDGVLYAHDRNTQHQTSHEILEIWRPLSLFIENNMPKQIENVYRVADQKGYLFNLEDGSQELLLNGFILSHLPTENVHDKINLDEEERVIQIVPLGDAFIYLTNQQRVILDGEIEYQSYKRTYQSLDVTDEFQLSEDEQFDITNQVQDTLGLITTKGRVFSLTALLWTFDLFDMTIDDLNDTFMEITKAYLENDPIVHIYINPDVIRILTQHGQYMFKNSITNQMIGTSADLLADEIIVATANDLFVTNMNRFFSMDLVQSGYELRPLLQEHLAVESYKISPDGDIVFIYTTDGDVFYRSNGYMYDLTYTFDRYDLLFESLTLHHGKYFEINEQFYKINQSDEVNPIAFGYSSYRIDGPHKVGEEVKIESYQNQNYELYGYLYNPSAEKPGYINMTYQDVFMSLDTKLVDESIAYIDVNGEDRGMIRYRNGGFITEEDILPLLHDTELIDFIYDQHYQMKIELPFQTLDQSIQLNLEVITKIKEEAIPVDVYFSSEALYYGTETFYGLEGDTLKDIVSQIDIFPHQIIDIYVNEEMTLLYNPSETIEPGVSLYVLTEPFDTNVLTMHVNDKNIIEIPFLGNSILSISMTRDIIRNYYKLGYYVFDIDMFKDESKTEPFDFIEINQDIEIWVTFDMPIFIELYEVDILGNVIDSHTVVWYEGISLASDDLKHMIYNIYPYQVKELYYDLSLEQPITEEIIDLEQHTSLYFTSEHAYGAHVTIHMYDLSKTYIETIEIYDRYYGLSYYLLHYGYDDVKLYTNDTFNIIYTRQSYEGLELYGVADEQYVNLTMIDTDFNETYELKYPKRLALDYMSMKLYMLNQNPMTQNISMFKDEALTISAVGLVINEDTTIYIKHTADETLIPVTFNISGVYNDSFTVYIDDNRYVSVFSYVYDRLHARYYDSYTYDVKVYDDLELATEISGFLPNELNQIYIHMVEKPVYSITFIDADTLDVIDVLEQYFIQDETYSITNLFEGLIDIPDQFIDRYFFDFYEDQALTIPVSEEIIDGNKTYYVSKSIPELVTFTYDFSDPNMDDLVLELYVNESFYQEALFNYIYSYYDPMQQIEFILIPSPIRNEINVEITVKPLHVVEFIYEYDGKKVSERILFRDGDVLDDSIFFGRLYNNPNDYDVYFYTDETFTDGSLVVTITEDTTFYLKVVRKY